jgi:hypothetical protein
LSELNETEARKLERALEKSIATEAKLTAHEVHCVEAERRTVDELRSLRTHVDTGHGQLREHVDQTHTKVMARLESIASDDVIAHASIRQDIHKLVLLMQGRWLYIGGTAILLLLGLVGYLLVDGTPWGGE